jgi:hypothetical protein
VRSIGAESRSRVAKTGPKQQFGARGGRADGDSRLVRVMAKPAQNRTRSPLRRAT